MVVDDGDVYFQGSDGTLMNKTILYQIGSAWITKNLHSDDVLQLPQLLIG